MSTSAALTAEYTRAAKATVIALAIAAAGTLGYSFFENGSRLAPLAPPGIPREGIFPLQTTAEIDGRRVTLRLTGQAVRKAATIALYRIAGYCDETAAPHNVDELAAADTVKELWLVMECDIPGWVLKRGFNESFARNDPEGKFEKEKTMMLDHLLRSPLKKGDRVVIAHLPGVGLSVRIRDEKPIVVRNPDFAFLVWRMYVGPHAVTPAVRRGLGKRLVAEGS